MVTVTSQHLAVACPHCGAAVGTRCRTRSGNVSRFPHGQRWKVWFDAGRPDDPRQAR